MTGPTSGPTSGPTGGATGRPIGVSRPRGLGEPRGPEFVAGELGPPPVPVPVAGPPGAAAGARRAPSRLLGTVLVAALAGGLAGAGGAYLAAPPAEGTAAQSLPRAAPLPSQSAQGLSATAARVLPSVVSVTVGRGGGSGFVIDAAGHVLTNAHVVSGESRVTVILEDGSRRAANVLGVDEGEDLAVLELADAAGLTPAALGRSSDLRVGEQVLAIGSPLGLSGTVTGGIVSALDREVRLGGTRKTAVQTDASINPGNSGGPLVNARGEVVGVNTAIASSRGGGNIGIGFAIPIDRAAPIAERIIRN
ncbi:S1C family serine protease [Nonomuraea sp. NPDC050663]|uniref:S1C family serine protease n=1 Tax=Nonomuraea sp. NPDC050663 TaxID=3364370 RepID=UPI0037B2A7D2